MNGFREVTCPHCMGGGLICDRDFQEYRCPLCGGKGLIKVLVNEGNLCHPPPTSAQLLARVVPLRGSGLGRRYPRYQPQPVSIYSDRTGRHGGGLKTA